MLTKTHTQRSNKLKDITSCKQFLGSLRGIKNHLAILSVSQINGSLIKHVLENIRWTILRSEICQKDGIKHCFAVLIEIVCSLIA